MPPNTDKNCSTVVDPLVRWTLHIVQGWIGNYSKNEHGRDTHGRKWGAVIGNTIEKALQKYMMHRTQLERVFQDTFLQAPIANKNFACKRRSGIEYVDTEQHSYVAPIISPIFHIFEQTIPLDNG